MLFEIKNVRVLFDLNRKKGPNKLNFKNYFLIIKFHWKVILFIDFHSSGTQNCDICPTTTSQSLTINISFFTTFILPVHDRMIFHHTESFDY